MIGDGWRFWRGKRESALPAPPPAMSENWPQLPRLVLRAMSAFLPLPCRVAPEWTSAPNCAVTFPLKGVSVGQLSEPASCHQCAGNSDLELMGFYLRSWRSSKIWSAEGERGKPRERRCQGGVWQCSQFLGHILPALGASTGLCFLMTELTWFLETEWVVPVTCSHRSADHGLQLCRPLWAAQPWAGWKPQDSR